MMVMRGVDVVTSPTAAVLADSGKCSRGGEGTRAVIAGNDESVPKGKRRPSPGD